MARPAEVHFDRSTGLIGSAVALLVSAAISVWGWIAIPDGTAVATHWGTSGEANGFSSKPVALLMLPLLILIVAALLAIVPSIEPRRRHLAESAPAYTAIWLGVLGLLVALHASAIANGAGYVFDVTAVVMAAVGILFILIGSVLSHLRSNFFAGIRTPWTLSSELSWRRTHRLVGWLFIAVGLAMVAGAPLQWTPWLTLGGTALIVLVSFVYSYAVWAHDPNRSAFGAR